MDQRTSDVEEDVKEILRTRLALAEKIQLLEQRVEETILGTKSAALDVINHARNTAIDFVESTAQNFNPTVQAVRRPWVLVGSAIAIGFLAGLMDQRKQSSGVYAYYPSKAKGADVMPSHGNGQPRSGVYPFYSAEPDGDTEVAGLGQITGIARVVRQVSSLWEDMTEEFAKERERIQGAVLETGRSFVRDVAHIVVQSLIDSLSRPGMPRLTHERTTSKY